MADKKIHTAETLWQERIAHRVVAQDDGCWFWTGAKSDKGYGKIGYKENGKYRYPQTHRISYEVHKGPIPEGLEIDHLCRNRACCNPDHLEAVTHRVNMLRGIAPMVLLHNAGVCKNGHPLSGDNLVYHKSHNPRCRTCWNAYHRKYRKQKRERT